ncbi:MAG: 3-phosphoshikimate 1-carboxyvinyltransferase [Bernardetiaceae bacterium]|nr:3-phosphoshikimate 1-carboxyvinyltransferase [Bernardetiaceae bacterium]
MREILPSVLVSHPTSKLKGEVLLPSSKSESNRLLIIRACSRQKFEIHRLSEANDTKVLSAALASKSDNLDVEDAGTAMRFLTAYKTISNQPCVLRGSPRMHERPIAYLVDALRQVGGKVSYMEKEGFPPLKIEGFEPYSEVYQLKIKGDISSQFISALMLSAPLLPKGLILDIMPPILSAPYIQLTAELMQNFGVLLSWTENRLMIPHQEYEGQDWEVESDWSAASYWYAMAAIAKEADIFLKGLRHNSLQGDARIAELMEKVGVSTTFERDGARIVKIGGNKNKWQLDLKDEPDLAQTLAVLAAARGMEMRLKGLHNLRLKETDRIQALQDSLLQVGIHSDTPAAGELLIHKGKAQPQPKESVLTYDDHRMVMSFAPLALLSPIRLAQPESVAKSYPRFWEDLKAMGFELKFSQSL